MLGCIVAGVTAVTTKDGRPRPDHVKSTPSKSYGWLPAVYDPVTRDRSPCRWYGFENVNYPTYGAACEIVLRDALLNETLYPVGSLSPYEYYYSNAMSDETTLEPYCYQGCFDMSGNASTRSAEFLRSSALKSIVVVVIAATMLMFSVIW